MAEIIMIAAPASGQGKTVITAALLRLLRQRGVRVAAAKVGPDYIDPSFHAAALGQPVINLDAWAMSPAELTARLAALTEDAELVIIEAVMGLFDGVMPAAGDAAAPANACIPGPCPAARSAEAEPASGAAFITNTASSADLAAMFGIPVLLVVDAARMGASAAALVHGFARLRADVEVAGVILNRLGSPRHGEILTSAIEAVAGLPVVGRFLRHEALRLPERHLGLVPAAEHTALDAWLDAAAKVAAESLSLCRLANLTRPARIDVGTSVSPALPPLAQRMAIARDEAFCFLYPHLLADWRAQGAEISFFSPLADEAPPEDAGAVFLPGGYPELHAGRLAAANRFVSGMRQAAERGTLIYGECGGFMVLGRGLVNAQGETHAMCDLLPFTSSFADRRLHLGYRLLVHDSPLPFPPALRGHEFHYASVVWQDEKVPPLFHVVSDATGNTLEPMGLHRGNVMGSFAHIISAGGTCPLLPDHPADN